MEEYDYMLKMLLIGDSGVGKTSLLSRFADTIFPESHISTIGVDFKIKVVDINGKKAKLQIWDTAGQERFRALTASYYRGSHGIVIVFSIIDYESFNHVKQWQHEIERYASPHALKLLIGNKSDVADKRVVSTIEAKEFADAFGMEYIETSARDSTNVDNMFMLMSTNILTKFRGKPVAAYMAPGITSAASMRGISLTHTTDKVFSNCC